MSKFRVKTRWTGWHHQHGKNTSHGGSPAPVAVAAPKFGDPDWVIQSGKHRGVKIMDLPVDFLEWAAVKMDWGWAKKELGRRHLSLHCPSPEKSSRLQKKQEKKEAFAEHQRQEAHTKLAQMQEGVVIVGSDYHRLRQDFDRLDGDADDCPFDAGDRHYSGPTMAFMGGKFVMVPSEFPREVQ